MEASLDEYAGKPVGVIVRSAAEMVEVSATNPFRNPALNRVVAFFFDVPPPRDALDG